MVRRAIGFLQGVGDARDLRGEVTQVAEHRARGARRVTMQVDERLERATVVGAAGILPVNGARRIRLHMVVVEIGDEIAAQVLAQHLLDERDVRIERFRAERCLEERTETGDDVVIEAIHLGDGYHVVFVRCERRVRHLHVVVVHGLALGCQDQPGLVERVPAEHATHRIRDEFLDHIACEELRALPRRLVRVGKRRVALERDALQRHVARHVIPHAIGIRHEFVVACLALALLLGNLAPMGVEVLHRRLHETAGIAALLRVKQREACEVPRGLVGVPVGFGGGDELPNHINGSNIL